MFGLLKFNSPPSCKCNACCSPLENLNMLHMQHVRYIKKLDIRFPTDFWVDVRSTVCLFPFPSTAGYLVLLSSVQTHALFSPLSKQDSYPLSLLSIHYSCLSLVVPKWQWLPEIWETQCVYRAAWERGSQGRITQLWPTTWGFQALC